MLADLPAAKAERFRAGDVINRTAACEVSSAALSKDSKGMAHMNPKSIVVRPIPHFLSEQSSAEEDQFVFAYTITIENHSDETAQLISRHWVITDANETVQEVRGDGVVGEQPVLQPGEAFRYTSGCTLPTPFGTMKGSYEMRTSNGQRFEADIPEFLLAVPSRLH